MNDTRTLIARTRWFFNAYRPVVVDFMTGAAIAVGVRPTQDRNVAQRAAVKLLAATIAG